jgi:hypothetical protein
VRAGPRRRLFLLGQFHALLAQAAQEQFQLGGVELLAFLAKEAPGQGIELLAQDRVLPAAVLQSLPQPGDLFAQLAQLGLEGCRIHYLAYSDA